VSTTKLTLIGKQSQDLSILTPSQLTAAIRQAVASAKRPWGSAVAIFPDEYYDLVAESNSRSRLARIDEELEAARKNREIDKLNRDAAWDRLSRKNAQIALGEVEGCSPAEIDAYFEGRK
jgi:hypothetical protein